MRFSKLVRIAMLVASLAACSNTLDRVHEERGAAELNQKLALQGSPFRFTLTDEKRQGYGVATKYVIGNPCTSAAAADPRLKADVLKNIGAAEVQFGGVAIPEVVQTRCVSATQAPLQIINEVWLVFRGADKIAYTVAMKASPKGGTNLEIHGPWGKAP